MNTSPIEELVQILIRSAAPFVAPPLGDGSLPTVDRRPSAPPVAERDAISPLSFLVRQVAGSDPQSALRPTPDTLGEALVSSSAHQPPAADSLLRFALSERTPPAALTHSITTPAVSSLAGSDHGIAAVLRSALEAFTPQSTVTPLLLPSNSTSASASPFGGLLSFLSSGFGMARLVTGIVGLFRRGEPSPEPLLPEFHLPESLAVEAALTDQGTGFQAVSRGLGDKIRFDVRNEKRAPAAQQVTVNVQALDSRSFVDHSEDIARAVREALLHSHTLSDTLVEL